MKEERLDVLFERWNRIVYFDETPEIRKKYVSDRLEFTYNYYMELIPVINDLLNNGITIIRNIDNKIIKDVNIGIEIIVEIILKIANILDVSDEEIKIIINNLFFDYYYEFTKRKLNVADFNTQFIVLYSDNYIKSNIKPNI